MSKDEDEQDISEDDSDEPKTEKRAVFTSDPIAKNKFCANETLPPIGTTLDRKTVEEGENTDANTNATTTTKSTKDSDCGRKRQH